MSEIKSEAAASGTRPALFAVGRVLITPNVSSSLSEAEIDGVLGRHARGDWNQESGDDGSPSEHYENHEALQFGYHILSSYKVREHEILVHTTRDRNLTRVMIAGEY